MQESAGCRSSTCGVFSHARAAAAAAAAAARATGCKSYANSGRDEQSYADGKNSAGLVPRLNVAQCRLQQCVRACVPAARAALSGSPEDRDPATAAELPGSSEISRATGAVNATEWRNKAAKKASQIAAAVKG